MRFEFLYPRADYSYPAVATHTPRVDPARYAVADYKAALRGELRNPEAWLEQMNNITSGTLRLLGWWVGSTILLSCAVGLLAFFWVSPKTFSLAELQQAMRAVIQVLALLLGALSLLANFGRFRNVFSERAFESLRSQAQAADTKANS